MQERSYEASIIKKAALIIVDEVTMMQKNAFEAVDRLFRKIMQMPDQPFGGKVVGFGGDFRQCLPVVPHGNRVKVIEMTIIKSSLWLSISQLRLTLNMRVSGTREQEHANWLIKLGIGDLNVHPELGRNVVEIPNHFIIPEKDMISHVFSPPGSFNRPNFAEYVSYRAILCPKNKDCLEINNFIIISIPGEAKAFMSIDTIDSQDQDEIANFPTEFLFNNSF